MNAAIALFLVCGALSLASRAQPFEAPPPAGAPRPVTIVAPVERALPNGLRVVVAQRRGLPLVTARLAIRSGSESDPERLAGLADLTATLLTKGTRRRTAPQIAQVAEALGGQLDSAATWHRSSVGITVTRPHLRAALDLLADVAMHPQFAAAEIDRARRIALDSLNVAMAQPESLARMAADRVVFGSGIYGHRAGGNLTSLARIKREDIVNLHARLYRPDNTTLILAGDIAPEAAMRLAQAAFGGWKAAGRGLPEPEVEVTKADAPTSVVIDMPDAGQAGVVVAATSVRRGAPDYYPGLVANALLGGGYSSRLSQEIRIKRGLSYSAGSRLEARQAGGLFVAAAQTKNASAPEVVATMLEEIAKTVAAPAAHEELDARKATLIGDFSRGLETTGGLAAQIASLEANAVDLAEMPRLIERVTNVSPQAVQAFARAHWRREDLRVVVAGDVSRFGDASLTSGRGAVRIDQKRIDLDAPSLLAPVSK